MVVLLVAGTVVAEAAVEVLRLLEVSSSFRLRSIRQSRIEILKLRETPGLMDLDNEDYQKADHESSYRGLSETTVEVTNHYGIESS